MFGFNARSTFLRTGLAVALGSAAALVAPAGPASAAVPGLVQVQATSPSTSVNKSVTVSCPAGKYVLTAAGYITGAVGSVVMDDVRPNPGLTSVTVTGDETDPFAGNWTVTAIAKCAYAPPGLTRVAATSASNSVDKSVTATCPGFTRVIGTGGEFTGGNGEVIMDDLTPNVGLTSVTVTGDEDAAYAPNWTVTAYAICANLLPGQVRVAATSAASSVNKVELASCPAGTVAIGTGGEITGALGEVVIDDLMAGPTSLSVAADEEDPFAGSWTATAYAICATP